MNEEQNEFECPLHFCLTCHHEFLKDGLERYVNKRLVTCCKCASAYHAFNPCIPAGSIHEDAHRILCPDCSCKVQNFKNKKIKTSQKVKNVSWCFACNEGGLLICCESCPAARHSACIAKEENRNPGKFYYCPECRNRNQFYYGDL